MVTYEDGRSSQEFHTSAESPNFVTHRFYPDSKLFTPPLHIHLIQIERLTVRRGIGHFYMSTSSQIPDPTTPTVKNEGECIEIPKGAYHRFENGGGPTDELVVDVELDPDNREQEFQFFRNFFGYADEREHDEHQLIQSDRYLSDCGKTNVQPSLFQIMLFMWTIRSPLAIPIPYAPASVGIAFSKWFCWFNGVVIGGWLLGYKTSYDEYYTTDLIDTQ